MSDESHDNSFNAVRRNSNLMSLFLLFVLTTNVEFKEANLLLFKVEGLNSTEVSAWLSIIWAYLLYRYYQFTAETDKHDLHKSVQTCAQRFFEKVEPIGILNEGANTLDFNYSLKKSRNSIIDHSTLRRPSEAQVINLTLKKQQVHCNEEKRNVKKKEKFNALLNGTEGIDQTLRFCLIRNRINAEILQHRFVIYETKKVHRINRNATIIAPFLQPIWLKYYLTYILASLVMVASILKYYEVI